MKRRRLQLFLTTHDMDDIEELCERIVIIDKGNILYNGNLIGLKREFITTSKLEVDLKEEANLQEIFQEEDFKLEKKNNGLAWNIIYPNTYKPGSIIRRVMDRVEVLDLKNEEVSLEGVIKQLYENKNLGG